MNPFGFVKRRPITTLIAVVVLVGGGVLGLAKMGVDPFPQPITRKIHLGLGYIETGAGKVKAYAISRYESFSRGGEEGTREEERKIVVSSPKVQEVVITQRYVCQIHSRQHINVCALDDGYLADILIKEGQHVTKNEVMFKIYPPVYQAEFDAAAAEARLAELELNNTRMLQKKGAQGIVSQNEVMLYEAKLARAKAKMAQAKANLDFTEVKAPFDGIVDRQHQQLGSLIKEGELLTTLSDNSLMWVYFNLPEARYLEYMASSDREKADQKIELVLADGSTFPEPGRNLVIEAKFNNETGNIPFRADFPNPKRLLRQGQTGTILIHRVLKDAIVIPQRATFELLDKRYVYVVGEDHVAHQRLITIQHELEDTFVIKSGLGVKDRIVLDGVREVRDGDKVEYEFREPDLVLANQKYHAE